MRVKDLFSLIIHPVELWKNIIWRFPKTISLGAPRSGTTLLKTLLCAHPNIGGMDYETTGIFHIRNVLRYDYYREHKEITYEEFNKIVKEAKDIIEFYDRFVDEVLKKIKKKRFVDKTILYRWTIPFILKYFPNAKILHIYRDGRDCYCSAKNHPHVPQGKSLKKYAHLWKYTIRTVNKYKDTANLFQIKYESLVKDPREELKKIILFVGEEFFETQLNPKEYSSTTTLHVASWHSRLTEPIKPKSVGRWKEELTKDEINIFNKICEKELKELGYLE